MENKIVSIDVDPYKVPMVNVKQSHRNLKTHYDLPHEMKFKKSLRKYEPLKRTKWKMKPQSLLSSKEANVGNELQTLTEIDMSEGSKERTFNKPKRLKRFKKLKPINKVKTTRIQSLRRKLSESEKAKPRGRNSPLSDITNVQYLDMSDKINSNSQYIKVVMENVNSHKTNFSDSVKENLKYHLKDRNSNNNEKVNIDHIAKRNIDDVTKYVNMVKENINYEKINTNDEKVSTNLDKTNVSSKDDKIVPVQPNRDKIILNNDKINKNRESIDKNNGKPINDAILDVYINKYIDDQEKEQFDYSNCEVKRKIKIRSSRNKRRIRMIVQQEFLETKEIEELLQVQFLLPTTGNNRRIKLSKQSEAPHNKQKHQKLSLNVNADGCKGKNSRTCIKSSSEKFSIAHVSGKVYKKPALFQEFRSTGIEKELKDKTQGCMSETKEQKITPDNTITPADQNVSTCESSTVAAIYNKSNFETRQKTPVSPKINGVGDKKNEESSIKDEDVDNSNHVEKDHTDKCSFNDHHKVNDYNSKSKSRKRTGLKSVKPVLSNTEFFKLKQKSVSKFSTAPSNEMLNNSYNTKPLTNENLDKMRIHTCLIRNINNTLKISKCPEENSRADRTQRSEIDESRSSKIIQEFRKLHKIVQEIEDNFEKLVQVNSNANNTIETEIPMRNHSFDKYRTTNFVEKTINETPDEKETVKKEQTSKPTSPDEVVELFHDVDYSEEEHTDFQKSHAILERKETFAEFRRFNKSMSRESKLNGDVDRLLNMGKSDQFINKPRKICRYLRGYTKYIVKDVPSA